MPSAPTFYIVPGSTVKRVIDDNRKQVFDAVEAAYRLHTSGDTVNPDSYFLRYPDKPSARIIALPAHLGGAVQRSGIKWISSFPENRASNLARASAVLILNDATTGYPLACIEASLISATRRASLRHDQGSDGGYPLPHEDIATGRQRDGATRTRLQSHPRHEHHRHPATHHSDEGICRSKESVDDEDVVAFASPRASDDVLDGRLNRITGEALDPFPSAMMREQFGLVLGYLCKLTSLLFPRSAHGAPASVHAIRCRKRRPVPARA